MGMISVCRSYFLVVVVAVVVYTVVVVVVTLVVDDGIAPVAAVIDWAVVAVLDGIALFAAVGVVVADDPPIVVPDVAMVLDVVALLSVVDLFVVDPDVVPMKRYKEILNLKNQKKMVSFSLILKSMSMK